MKCGMIRRRGYRNGWGIRIRNSQRLNSFSSLKHTITLNSSPSMKVRLPFSLPLPLARVNTDVVEDVVYDKMMDKFDKEFIGLDHPDRTPGRKPGLGEKALSIKS